MPKTQEIPKTKLSPKQLIQYFIKAHYPEEAKELKDNEELNSLKIDFRNFIGTLEEEGYNGLFESKPKDVIDAANSVINECCNKEYSTVILEDVPYNIYLRLLEAKHIGKFISTNAMVKSVSQPAAIPIISVFECRSCNRLQRIIQDKAILKEPGLCVECGGKNFQLMEEKTVFINKQRLKLEEPLELRKDGTTREFNAIIRGDIVNPNKKMIPGEVVKVVGFLNNSYNDKTKEFNFLLDLNNVTKLDKTFQDIELTEEDINEIHALVKDTNLMQKLKNSVAPTIYGHEEIKEGLVLQLFSGNSTKYLEDKTRRSIIHILLVGDPGIAKSETLKNVAKLSPKGISVNGAGATKAGIMGAAVKDELTGKWTIEAGAMPLADQGIICIDELDKMPKGVVLSLNEPMEQQTVTETKAGLNVTMNARTPVLAAANPKYGRFLNDKTITEQINIPDTTFSRFDLIYAIEDKTNYDNDIELAKHLLNNDNHLETEILEPELIRKYIAYAKRDFSPEMTPEATKLISLFYADTRKKAAEDDEAKPITVRDLLAVERIAVTYAKIHLRNYVNELDAKEAIRVYSEALKTLGLSPTTAGELEGIMSDKDIEILQKAESIIKSYYNDYGKTMPYEALNDLTSELMLTCNFEEPYAARVISEILSNIKD